jgi:YYY domain-containing protein
VKSRSAGWLGFLKGWKQLRQTEPEILGLGAVLLVAMILRCLRPDWYLDRQFHPDERWIMGVVSQLSYPAEPAGLQYGTFPLYLLALIKDLAAYVGGWFGPFDPNRFVIWAGRMLSAGFDLTTLVFTYLIGRRLWPGAKGRQLGLLSAAFLAFSVLNIQMAHFFVVDVPLTTLAAGCLFWAIGIAQTGSRRDYLGAGICLGLAMATKTSAMPLAAAVGAAHLLGLNRAEPEERRGRWQELGLAVAASLAAFFVSMPYAFLDWSRFWSNQDEQRRILVTGMADVPYNRQYLHTTPFIYYIKNLLRYTLGWPLGLLGLAGFIGYPLGIVVQTGRGLAAKARHKWQAGLQAEAGFITILSFGLVYAAVIGFSFAKFNRYLLPLTPLFCLAAGRLALDAYHRVTAAWARKTVAAGIGLVLAATMLWALAFTSIYQKEHPWIAASRWLLTHVPAVTQENGLPHQTAILNEEWGDDLPVYVKDVPGLAYHINKFPVQEPDSPRKREFILAMLPGNDIIVMADTRAHAVYRRLADRYPVNAAYYELMFEEKLGYSLAAEFKNYPSLLGHAFPDDRADESFTLYDHPHVFLFQRQPVNLPPEELARRLDTRIGEILKRTVKVELREPVAKVQPRPTPLPKVVNNNIGQTQGRPVFIFGHLNSFTAGLAWIVLLEVIGLLSLPLCLTLFPRLPDAGVSLGKIVGSLIFTWIVWVLVSTGLARHLQGTSLLVLLGLGGLSAVWAYRRQTEILEFFKSRGRLWWASETVFLVAFILYMLTKLYNPDIHNPFGQGYNGGGEPMGMSFFSSAYKSVHFPPYDPWLSGYPINYYYFGQVMLGIMAKLIGVPPAWSYNIAISLIFALTVSGVFGLGLALTGKRRWGLLAAVAAGMLGNLHTFFYLMEPFNRGMNWNEMLPSIGRLLQETWFHAGRFEFIWNPTRLIKGTINEMPWFSFLYGDLHAHIIAIPYSLPLIGWGINLLLPSNSRHAFFPEASGQTGRERGLSFFVTALTLGALSAINTWNFPPYALLVLGVLLIQAFNGLQGKGLPWPALAAAGLAWLRLVVGGLVLLFFFHKNFIPQSTSLAFVNPAVRTTLKDFLVFFGLAIFVLMTFWAQQLFPSIQTGLKKLGWKPKGRTPLWQQLPGISRAAWEKYPWGVYLLTSALIGFTLLVMFDQLLLGVLGLLVVLCFYILAWRPLSPQMRVATLLAFLGLAIVFGCEIVHVRDFMGTGGDMSRMNTVFKFYMIVWIFFALALAAALSQIFSAKRESVQAWKKLLALPVWQLPVYSLGVLGIWAAANYFQENTGTPWLALVLALALLILPWVLAGLPKYQPVRITWIAVLMAVLFSVFLYPPVSMYNRMRLCSGFQHPTLNGEAYLDRMLPREAKALAWINQNMDQAEIILEAPGHQGYNCFDTRVAVFTGHPTLIGWVGEEEQMRYNNELTGSHTRDADLIFSTVDPGEARRLMDQYQVHYVYVGENERKTYPAQGLAKFRQFMKVIYEQDGVTIYKKR